MKVKVWTCVACDQYEVFEDVVALSAVQDLVLQLRESGYEGHKRFEEGVWDRFVVTWR